ncbi:unnamed protein product [Prunus armeniaca]|uniref:Phospholipase/carboxylesterase/thioesterase domain-containing protein n=1 Tax=Prunus armeniaca TaxID=36596 RepID=A0A6J5WSC0_PRUAR|nr:unnamed protein product [Prunus armeniaca]
MHFGLYVSCSTPSGYSASQLLESLPLPNIKWICPTAPTRPVAILGGFPCTAWFEMGELSDDGPDDWESLELQHMHHNCELVVTH